MKLALAFLILAGGFLWFSAVVEPVIRCFAVGGVMVADSRGAACVPSDRKPAHPLMETIR